jgi:divalent metal cation (Fe/Co/Zn/Cd) transporter
MSSPSLELPVLRVTPARSAPLDARERDRLIRRAKTLSWLSLAYMTAEGAIAITAAILASSVALLGFGLDSAIEALASIIVIWRYTGTRPLSEHAEQRAQRLVAITFFLLAPYIAQDAIRTLINREHSTTSWLGIGLSISSIIVMPLLGKAKQRIGRRLGSGATAGEGTQNMLCAYLAAGVLTGLVLNMALGLWWADPAVALGISALAINEGRHAWAGEDCCAASPIPPQPTPTPAPRLAAANGQRVSCSGCRSWMDP